jgi:hypothetical protein
LRAESGEIALSVDQGHWQRTRRKPHWFWMEPEGQLEPAPDPVSEMSESAAGNAIMAGWLSEVRAQVEQEGELTEPATKIPFSGRPNSLSRKLQRLRVVLSQNSGADNPASQREANKQQALRAIDLKLQQLQSCEAACAKREAADEAARQDAAVLPSPDVLDKIMRYETTLQRQMYRAMSQLERLQRMRHGEAVPAPIMMELSERAWSQKCIFAKRTQNAEVASGS